LKKNSLKIGFAGLTHLGLVSSTIAASKGFSVVCYHNDKKKIDELKKGKTVIEEPGLKNLLHQNKNKIIFSADENKLSNCRIIYISLDVETDKFGNSDLSKVKKIINKVKKIAKKDSILVILSQVPPGFTRKVKWNKDKLFYQVETLVFGDAIKRSLYPERIIVGCSNSKKINKNFKKYLKSYNSPILAMKYESAELTKMSINAFLSSSITTTNTLSEICEKIDADWSEIKPALTTDKRIGKYAYTDPGLGISGGNLERDLNGLIKIGKKNKTDFKVIKTWISNSTYRKKWIWDKLNELILKKTKKPKISILGLAYKENTNSIKNAPSIFLLKKLKGYNVQAYDPCIKKRDIKYKINFTNNSIQTLKNSDVLLILTPWKEFKFLTPKVLIKNMKKKIVIDPFRVLNGNLLMRSGFIYASLGKK
tara:strand:- start:15497 stop:16765 length:1269 start_codon:yes stop_codon:yes gene_type:complete